MKSKLASLVLLAASLALAPAEGAQHAWIASSTEIFAIDVESDQVAARIPTNGGAFFVEASPGRRHAFAIGGSPSLLIDSGALAPVASFDGYTRFQLHPTREEAYVTPGVGFPTGPPNPTQVFSTQSLAVVGQLNTDIAIAFDLARERGYFATSGGSGWSVAEIDLTTRGVLRSFPLPGPAGYGDVDPQARLLYVPVPSTQAGAPLSQVRVFDLVTGLERPPINTGSPPGVARLNPARTRLFVLQGASLWSIDTSTGLPVATIAVAPSPRAIDVTPAGDKIFVVSAGQVAVVDSELRGSKPLPLPGSDFRANFRFIGGVGATADSRPGPATGLWWNPAESGWGLHITQRRSTFFAVLFHYDANRIAKWFVAPSCVPNVPCADCVDGIVCHGTVYETNGPAFFHAAFNPAAVVRREAGLMELQFTDRDNATATFVIASQQRRVPIRRQVFAARPTLATDYTDLWWNPLESGWGLGITQQSNVMFLTWFVYDDAGRPSWLVASNCLVKEAGNGCRGALYRASGPLGPVPGPAGFDSAALRVSDVGTVDVAFEGANNGTISWTVDGRSGSRAITRQVF
jgi:hypothetical protein